MIHVIAIVAAKPGQRPALLKVFNANAPTVRAEVGCIEYGAAIDIVGAAPAFGPDTFVVVEKWKSLAALKAHAAAPHMKAYLERSKDLRLSTAVHVLDPV